MPGRRADVPIFHLSTDLRGRDLDRHRGRRPGRVCRVAGGEIPGDRAADGEGHRVLPGANAATMAETVAAPIEQEVNGVEGMLYMSSNSADDGSCTLTVTFEMGTDMDMAQVLVQNRVAIAEPKLPEEVRRQGITTKKQSTQIVQFITLSPP